MLLIQRLEHGCFIKTGLAPVNETLLEKRGESLPLEKVAHVRDLRSRSLLRTFALFWPSFFPVCPVF